MKANELQIGDLVFVGGIPRKVCSITKKKIGYHREEYASRLFYARMYEVFPIHLTAEILEKNGFDSKTFLSDEWDKEVYFREFPGCVLEPNDDGKYTFGTICYWNKQAPDGSPEDWGAAYESRIKGLYYVHELQHALRLCGLTKLADNLKV